MPKKQRGAILGVLLLLVVAALTAVLYIRLTSVTSVPESTPVPSPEETFPVYTPGAPLTAPAGDFVPAECFDCVSTEKQLYNLRINVSPYAELYAAGNKLYVHDLGKLCCMDVVSGASAECAAPVGTHYAGTLADGSLWLVTEDGKTSLHIYSPDCREVLNYTLKNSAPLYWAAVSPDGSRALFCFEAGLEIYELSCGERRIVSGNFSMLSNIFFLPGGDIIASDGHGTVSIDVSSGKINAVAGLEGMHPVSLAYAAAVDYDGAAVLRDIAAPENAAYLPGEGASATGFTVDGSLLLRVDDTVSAGVTLRRMYNLSTGALTQWVGDDREAGDAALSADFGWGAYVSGSGVHLITTDKLLSACAAPDDAYMLSLPQTAGGDIAAEVYRRTGVKIFWGERGTHFASEVFEASPVGEEACLPTLEILGRFFTSLPEGMVQELICGTAQELNVYVCSALHTVPDIGWSTGGFTDILDGKLCIVLNNDDLYWMEGNIAHEFWHAAEYRMRALESSSGIPYISRWAELMPEEIRALYWDNGMGSIDSRWLNDSAYCGDGNDAPENIWFVRAYARSDPGEDRATVFEALHWAAEQPLLQSCTHLGEKAEYLCTLLRTCYPSCTNTDTLPWEAALQQ